jgi:exopolysaccharide biosynthesis polyprenyl glycosylphosphotransferase
MRGPARVLVGQVERNKGATWVQALWHLSDLLAICGGFLIGYWVRFHSPFASWVPPDKGIPPLRVYLVGGAITALVWTVLMHAGGLYRLEHARPRHRLTDLVRVQAFGMVVVAAMSFFYRDVTFSRLAMPLIWLFTVLLTVAGRGLVQVWLRHWSRLRPIRFALVGAGPAADRLVRSLGQSSYPHEFVGYLAVSGETGAGPAPLLGSVSQIRTLSSQLRLDMIVMASPSTSPALLQEVYSQCQEMDLDVLFVPDFLSLWSRPVRVEDADGLPIIRLRDLRLVGWNGVAKRALDLAVSVPLLILLAPLFLAIAIAVKLDSPGPVFHRQERVGRDRRPFRMLKFRSMRVDAEEKTGPVWAAREDPRRTRIGMSLRKWSLDELPQLWNVLVGRMSLVGPRPERPVFVQQFEGRVADYYDRHRVKSGITGWAQIHGLRGDTPIEERTRYDLFYVENWSIWLDLRILALTALAVFRHRGS